MDEIWGEARPSLPSSHLRVHDIKYAGVDVRTKLQNLRKEMSMAGASAIIITMLDEVAWLFNLVRKFNLIHFILYLSFLKRYCSM